MGKWYNPGHFGKIRKEEYFEKYLYFFPDKILLELADASPPKTIGFLTVRLSSIVLSSLPNDSYYPRTNQKRTKNYLLIGLS